MKTKLISLLLVTLLITACNPCKRLAKRCPPIIKDSISYIETVMEDPNYTIPDSAFWQFVFECDSNYNVLLRELNESNTGLRTETKIEKIYITDEKTKSILLVSLKASSDSILTLNKTIEKLKRNIKTITVEVDKPIYIYRTRKWVKILAWIGAVSIILVIIWLVYRFRGKLLKSLLNQLKN